MINIAHQVEDPFDMPLCPICGSVIEGHEPAVVVTAYDALGLAHAMCAEESADE